MKRKTVSILIALSLAMLLTACGSEASVDAETNPGGNISTAEASTKEDDTAADNEWYAGWPAATGTDRAPLCSENNETAGIC